MKKSTQDIKMLELENFIYEYMITHKQRYFGLIDLTEDIFRGLLRLIC